MMNKLPSDRHVSITLNVVVARMQNKMYNRMAKGLLKSDQTNEQVNDRTAANGKKIKRARKPTHNQN